MIKIFILKGPEQERSYVLDRKTAQMGRGPANHVILSERTVSRRHAKVYVDDDLYYIEDLQSKNGTWINGNLIESGVRVQVQQGIPIAVGNVLLSLGKKCAPTDLPNQYSIDIQPPGDGGPDPTTSADRRATEIEEMQLLYDISVEVLGTLDLNELCAKALAFIAGLSAGIESGIVFLMDSESGKIRRIAGRFTEKSTADEPPHVRSLVRSVMKKSKAVMILDTVIENQADVSGGRKVGAKSAVCMSLVGKMGTRGAIYLQSTNVPHGFQKSDLFLLSSLSGPIAVAIENALLYARSKRAEEKFQKASEHLEKEVMNRTSELEKTKDHLEKLSITDALSGLYNYRHLMRSIESELSRAIRYHHTLSLLLMDIDYFKALNDTYGHLCGDHVIRTVGKLLNGNVRATDVVARYGGDELAVVLIETNAKTAQEVAEKLKQTIESHDFKWRSNKLNVNVSIGVATAPAPEIQEVSQMIEAADKALYQAKNAGRNAVVVFGQE